MSNPLSKSERAQMMSRAIQESREQYMLRVELFDVIAREERAKFDAYVASGFTAEQSLRLCIADKQRPA